MSTDQVTRARRFATVIVGCRMLARLAPARAEDWRAIARRTETLASAEGLTLSEVSEEYLYESARLGGVELHRAIANEAGALGWSTSSVNRPLADEIAASADRAARLHPGFDHLTPKRGGDVESDDACSVIDCVVFDEYVL